MAEAQFREGGASCSLNNTAEAAEHFQKARDYDALVFRADSRINGIIHDTARQMAGSDLALATPPLLARKPGKIAGQETFYEHVHLNFDGNYRLGKLWAEQAERLLPDDVKNKAKGGWASQEICEARLGLTDWNRGDVFNEARRRVEGPPFDSQIDNAQRVSRLSAEIARLFHPHDPPLWPTPALSTTTPSPAPRAIIGCTKTTANFSN